jgi:UDP-galactopyranose mutase
MLQRYVELARTAPGVSFIGRLGTYRYLDMDVSIGEALRAAEAMLEAIRRGQSIPTFFTN